MNSSPKEPSYVIWEPPPAAGYYEIGGNFHFHMEKRPRWIARVLMAWLLDWKWHDF